MLHHINFLFLSTVYHVQLCLTTKEFYDDDDDYNQQD